MEKLKIALCDDSAAERKDILDIISQATVLSDVETFESGEAFLQSFFSGKYDLVLMDIYMSGISGIDVITRLREIDENVLVAFITTSTDFALESYRLDAVKYIEKPASAKKIGDLLELARIKKERRPGFSLKSGKSNIEIPLDRVLFFEQRAHEVHIHLIGGEELESAEKLDLVESTINSPDFFRCHKSFLVNLRYVKALDSALLLFVMKEGANVYIRRGSLSRAKKEFEANLFSAAIRTEIAQPERRKDKAQSAVFPV